MTTTIKSNSDGSSAIQTGGVDRIQIDTSGNVNVVGTLTAGSLSAFTGTNQSLAANGYQKLPGGLIMQWGTIASGTASDVSISFSTPFLTAVYSVTTGMVGPTLAGNSLLSCAVDQVTLSSFTARPRFTTAGTTGVASQGYTWFAIGK